MKKTMMQLAVMGMVLACSQAVFAQPSVLRVFDGYTRPDGTVIPPTDIKHEEGGIHKNGWGQVFLEATPTLEGKDGGAWVTVMLRQGARSYTYLVFYKQGAVKPPFTTDKKGNGGIKFHVNKVSEFAQVIGIHSAKTEKALWYAYNPLYVPPAP
jgi:hypothetical protein